MFRITVFKKFQDEVFQLGVAMVTEPDDNYEVRSSKTGRDSQRYLLAVVYHVEMYSLRTILFVIALDLSQIPKVVYHTTTINAWSWTWQCVCIIRCEYSGNIYHWNPPVGSGTPAFRLGSRINPHRHRGVVKVHWRVPWVGGLFSWVVATFTL